MSPWEVLGLTEGERDRKTIKRAYARELKLHRPEEDPEGFQRVRAAYETVLQWTRDGGSDLPRLVDLAPSCFETDEDDPLEDDLESESVAEPEPSPGQAVTVTDPDEALRRLAELFSAGEIDAVAWGVGSMSVAQGNARLLVDLPRELLFRELDQDQHLVTRTVLDVLTRSRERTELAAFAETFVERAERTCYRRVGELANWLAEQLALHQPELARRCLDLACEHHPRRHEGVTERAEGLLVASRELDRLPEVPRRFIVSVLTVGHWNPRRPDPTLVECLEVIARLPKDSPVRHHLDAVSPELLEAARRYGRPKRSKEETEAKNELGGCWWLGLIPLMGSLARACQGWAET
ncbi:MAG: J domain-containing protein [Acidobacteriota bacterium]